MVTEVGDVTQAGHGAASALSRPVADSEARLDVDGVPCVSLLTRGESARDAVSGALPFATVQVRHRASSFALERVGEQDVIIIDLDDVADGLEPFAACCGRCGFAVVTASHDGVKLRQFERKELANLAKYVRCMVEVPERSVDEMLLGCSEHMAELREQVRRVARYRDVPVLILGETGTGKDVVARAIHSLSNACAPYVPINAAAIPESLFESELFGHEAGSYTGARGRRGGLLEMAGDGTVFLDEVGDMPQTLQPKLLRALESRTYRRVGSNVDLPLSARVISATHRLQEDGDGVFRADLLYRLAGFVIELLPLRSRPDDVAPLAEAFLRDFAARNGIDGVVLTREARQELLACRWPGNVRQLKTTLEHAAILAGAREIGSEHVRDALRPTLKRPPGLGASVGSAPGPSRTEPSTLRGVESELIRQAWRQNEGNVSRTARQLGIARSTLRDRLKRYGIISA